MLEKRLFIIILLTGFLLGAHPVLSQTGTEKFTKAKLLEAEAREKERAGYYPAAMEVYERALESETDIKEREELQKNLGGVITRYYMDLYQRARRASSRPEMMKITILALSLGVEGRTDEGGNVFRKLGGWFRGSDKDLEKAMEFIQERRLEVFVQLRKEAEEANRKRAYKQAASLYDQARELDPELYNQKKLAVQYKRIRNRIDGQQLALEGQRLLEERKYQEAREKFQRAKTLYPGQAAVEEGLREIKSEVEIREALLAFFDGRSEESIQILEAALEVIGDGYVQVHALLGAMYCHQTFISPEPDMAFLESAKAQFQRVLHLQPNYQFSEKLFSPRILEFFEQIRSVTRGGVIIPTATATAP
jgi:tetratricopeptide (TPR) repeat protein